MIAYTGILPEAMSLARAGKFHIPFCFSLIIAASIRRSNLKDNQETKNLSVAQRGAASAPQASYARTISIVCK